jgi:hypothetical protein
MSTHVAPPLAHTVNTSTNGHSSGKVAGASHHRTHVGGLNLQSSQAVSIVGGQKHELMYVPASSVPNFGSYGVIDIKDKNVLIHGINLQFVCSPVVGSGLTGYFNPASYFFQRIEVVINGVVIDQLMGNQQHLLTQFLEFDEDRLSLGLAQGLYSSSANRTALSSQSTTNTFNIQLKSFFEQSKGLAILTNQHEIQLRIYMSNLADVFYVSAGTLTSCTVQSCTAICDVTRMNAETSAKKLQEMTVHPEHSIYHQNSYMTYTVPIGTTSINIILGALTGSMAGLCFTVRASTVGLGAWNYTQLASFALLDAGGQNIVGGQNIPSAYSSLIMNSRNIKSSYNVETALGTTDNKANFYIWSHSASLADALEHGRALSSRKYTGNDQLVLQFPAATTVLQTVDIYGFLETVLEYTATSVNKTVL